MILIEDALADHNRTLSTAPLRTAHTTYSQPATQAAPLTPTGILVVQMIFVLKPINTEQYIYLWRLCMLCIIVIILIIVVRSIYTAAMHTTPIIMRDSTPPPSILCAYTVVYVILILHAAALYHNYFQKLFIYYRAYLIARRTMYYTI